MSRRVLVGDALALLPSLARQHVLFTSLPDAAEMGVDPDDHWAWFRRAARLCFQATLRTGVTVFYQTDRRQAGHLFSKAGLLLVVAALHNRHLLWHKVVLRRSAGVVDLYRPTYSHLLAFSEEGLAGKPTPDVLQGQPLYRDGMAVPAAQFVADWGRRFGPRFCDPFCGRGTALAAADLVAPAYETVTGIELLPDVAAMALQLQLGAAPELALG